MNTSFLKRFLTRCRLQLFIPERIYAAVGKECNLYFNNIITTLKKDYFFEVNCKIGRTDSDRFRIIPTAEDIGEHPMTIKIYDDRGLAAEKKLTLTVAPEVSTKKQFTLLLVGDSQTVEEGYPDQLYTLLQAEENISFDMLGTNSAKYAPPSPDRARHEGYGGWGWRTFFQNYGIDENDDNDGLHPRNPSVRNSRFLFPDSDGCKFDLKMYCEKYGNRKFPDYIFIMLGTNDVFCCKSDREVDKEWNEKIYPYMEKMVSEFRKYTPDVHIAFCTISPGAASQDAFGKCYKTSYNLYRWRLNLQRYHLKLQKAAKKFNIGLIPVHTAIDCKHGFPLEEESVNMNSEQKVFRVCNAVHPNRSGYNQIADCVFAYLKNQLAGK